MKTSAKPGHTKTMGGLKAGAMTIAISAVLSNHAQAAFTCLPQGSEILLDALPSDDVMKALELKPAKAKVRDEGKFRLSQKDGRALVATTDGAKLCVIAIQDLLERGATTTSTTTLAEITDKVAKDMDAKKAIEDKADEAKKELDALVKKLIIEGESDIGVPSAPAAAILGLETSKATTPRSPKELAAAIVNGRAADGKVKSGVSLDFSLAQFLAMVRYLDWNAEKKGFTLKEGQVQPALKSFFPERRNSPTKLAQYRGLALSQPGSFTESIVNFTGVAGDAPQGEVTPDNTHRLANRVKLSIATTQTQDDKVKPASDLSFGMHYVFFDDADPNTTRCDGENAKTQKLLLAIKEFAGGSDLPNSAGLRNLRKIWVKKLQDATDDAKIWDRVDKELDIIEAACSLTPAERVRAKAFMVGLANSYTLTDGGWGTRTSGAKGLWIGAVSPGLGVGRAGALQAVGHLRFIRNQLVQDPTKSGATFLQDATQRILRLKLSGPSGNVSYELSHSKNKSIGKDETVKRRGIAAEWQVAKGVWLVGSGGKETRSLGGSTSTPFVITSLRFGGNSFSTGGM